MDDYRFLRSKLFDRLGRADRDTRGILAVTALQRYRIPFSNHQMESRLGPWGFGYGLDPVLRCGVFHCAGEDTASASQAFFDVQIDNLLHGELLH